MRETLLLALTAQAVTPRTCHSPGGTVCAPSKQVEPISGRQGGSDESAAALQALGRRLSKLEQAEVQRAPAPRVSSGDATPGERAAGKVSPAASDPAAAAPKDRAGLKTQVAELKTQVAGLAQELSRLKSHPAAASRQSPDHGILQEKAALLRLRQEIKDELKAVRRGDSPRSRGSGLEKAPPAALAPPTAAPGAGAVTRGPVESSRAEMEKQILEAEALLQDKLKTMEAINQ